MSILKGVREIPILVAYEKDVEKYAEVCASCVRYVLKEKLDISRFFPVRLIGDYWFEGDHGSIAWYLYNCEKGRGSFGLRYRASSLLNLFSFDTLQWYEPHLKILIIKSDLYEEGIDGYAFPVHSMSRRLTSRSFKKFKSCGRVGINVPGIVFSICRIEKYYKGVSKAVFIVLGIREIARLFGVLEREDEVRDEYEKRCVRGDCVMGVGRYIKGVEEVGSISERAEKSDSFFCRRCGEELVERKKYWIRSLFEVNL